MTTHSSNDEIDLLELLAKVVLIIKRNTIIILLAFISGSLLGLAYYQFVPSTYASTMVITSDILTESYSKTLFKNINQLISEENVSVISSKLNIDPELASKIGKIEIESATERSDGLKEEDKKFLTISAKANNNTVWPELQKGIIYYIQNNEFVKKRVKQRKESLTEIITRIDSEVKDLQSMKLQFYKGESAHTEKGNVVFVGETSISTEIVDLLIEKSKSQELLLETVNSVQVVEGFTIYKNPAGPKLSISLVAGASFGLFFVAIIIAFKGIRSMLRYSEEKLAKA